MCGICCCLFTENERSRSNFQVVSKSVLPHLERRGPDHTGTKEFSITNYHETFCLTLIGTVLHLRGSKTPQPLIDECGNILLWNGEIFGGVEVKENENDSFVLLKMLSSHLSGMTYAEHILSTMVKVQGPWSFVYWQATEQKMWLGRDYFGRRSLLWHLPSSPDDVLAVTSVTERNSTSTDYNLRFEEVPADGLYCVDFMDLRSGQDYKQPFRISKFEWKSINDELQNDLFLACPVLPFNKQMPTEEDLQVIDENRRRVCPLNKREMEGNFPKERITLVEKANDPKEAEEHVPENDISCREIAENTTELDNLEIKDARLKCDLEKINCLEGCVNSVDANMCPSYPTSTRNIEFDVSKEQSSPDSNSLLNTNHCSVGASSHILTLNEASDRKNIPQGCCRNSLLNSPWNFSFEESRDKFIAVLGEAVRKRVFNLPRTNDNSVSSCSQETLSRLIDAGSVSQEQSFASSGATENDARVGILFSGGVDSMMIAVLADKFVPSGEAIDLINVAFEQKSQPVIPQNKTGKKRKTRQNATSPKPKEINFSVPDRITGIAGLEELQHINPARRWNFIEVDVTLEELQEMRSRHISHLVSPLNTVLDDSIGCALWFGARGRGRLHSSSVNAGVTDSVVENREEEYTSKAKVLLVGMGADEQLGGYARHRTRFLNEGWSGLMDEMEMEVKRISKRNLGRDDRCISDHGREARFPFLDEEVVSFLNSLPVWVKTDPGLPRGTGEKLLLRQAAKLLGMTSSAELPKRAIQFGSRIAKLESSGEKGSEACSRLEV